MSIHIRFYQGLSIKLQVRSDIIISPYRDSEFTHPWELDSSMAITESRIIKLYIWIFFLQKMYCFASEGFYQPSGAVWLTFMIYALFWASKS